MSDLYLPDLPTVQREARDQVDRVCGKHQELNRGYSDAQLVRALVLLLCAAAAVLVIIALGWVVYAFQG